MTANPNPGGNVYNRNTPEDLHQSWNAVIRKVNEERANPPEDTSCEELDPIEEVDEDHIWTKQDVEDIRSAIDEMCEFAWVEELEFWHDNILIEIDDALAREYGGWGDEGECCEEGCLPDCDNAQPEPVITYIGTYTLTACLANPPPSECVPNRELAEEAGSRCSLAIARWASRWSEYCVLVSQVETLERELEALEAQLAVLKEIRDEECAKPPPNRCAQRQQAVDDKQQEVDDKQTELDEKEAERDAKLEEVDEQDAIAESEATSSMAYCDASAPPGCQLYFSSLPGTVPWTNMACDELGPECLGKDPTRCRTSWSIQRWSHTYFCWGGEWHSSSWWTAVTGGYTMRGTAYISAMRACGGVSGYACESSGPSPCIGGQCGTGCAAYLEREIRLVQGFPETHPGGEECCE